MCKRGRRLRIGVSQALEAWPKQLPVSGEGFRDDHCDAPCRDDDAGGRAQDPLAEAAQTPAVAGSGLHETSTGMNKFIGENVEQQDDLVVGEGIGRTLARGQAVSLAMAFAARRG